MFKPVKKKILLAILTLLFFLAAGQVHAYISKSTLTDELASDDWQGGSQAFYNFGRTLESGKTFLVGSGKKEVDEQLQKSGKQSAASSINNLIAMIYANPPASSVEYFADLGQRLNLVKPVYAQGTGFKGLSPILPIWKAFRNIAYLFFTIIFVVMGFAIMFRVKLNPQTVISIQNAIPRVIIALLLVTFSYAIAGFLIDLLYVFLSLSITVASSFGLIPLEDIDTIKESFLSGGFGATTLTMFGSVPGGIWKGVGLIGALVGFAVTIITGNILVAAGSAVGGAVIFELILAIIIVYVLFKLFLGLLKAYIGIILAVIFAPLQIMLNALPGQNTFGSWLRGLLANIAVFPGVAIFLLIARAIMNQLETASLWQAPLLGASGSIIAGLIGLGMLLIIHKVPDMIKEALEIKPFPYGAAIGEGLKPVTAPAGWIVGGVSREAQERVGRAVPEVATGTWGRVKEVLRYGRRQRPEKPIQT